MFGMETVVATLAQVEDPGEPFVLPIVFDYGATLVFALSGALLAARRGYDLSGTMAIAIVSSTGGGLLRDGIFLNQGPPALVRSWVYLAIIALATLTVALFGRHVSQIPRFDLVISMSDSAGIGAFALVGMIMSRNAGLPVAASILIGIVNAVGGGLLRDLLVNREPDVFRPGVPMALAAFFGCLVFLTLNRGFDISENLAAWISIVTVFVVRSTALYLDVRTKPILGFEHHDP